MHDRIPEKKDSSASQSQCHTSIKYPLLPRRQMLRIPQADLEFIVFRALKDKALHYWREYQMLYQAFWVALALHVVFFPVIWIAGWALPWPRVPIITTIVEYDLRGWPDIAKPKKIYELMEDRK